jgi:hypothetical protein
MYKWSDFRAQQERYNDLLREAEQDRLVHQAMQKKGGWIQAFDWVLARLGSWLVVFGTWLQKRSGPAAGQATLVAMHMTSAPCDCDCE